MKLSFDINDKNFKIVPFTPLSELENSKSLIVVLHPEQYKIVRTESNFKECSKDDIVNKEMYGKNGNLEIYVSTLIPKGEMGIFEAE